VRSDAQQPTAATAQGVIAATDSVLPLDMTIVTVSVDREDWFVARRDG
jgi:hypothetical protein